MRKEIEEAFTCEVPVVPDPGRPQTSRLSKADLPPELQRLADLNPIRSTPATPSGVERIGDLMTDMVPGLDYLTRDRGGAARSDSVTNSIRDREWDSRTEP